MNIQAYTDAIRRTGQNLPSVLADWGSLDDDLVSHYRDSLVELLVSRDEAERSAASESQQQGFRREWDWFLAALVPYSASISVLMGIDVLSLLAPPSVTMGCARHSAQSCASDTYVGDWAAEPLAA